MQYKTKFEGYDYRPIIDVNIDGKLQVSAMYDTGADIAVISVVDKLFNKLDATLICKNVQFKGFGGIVNGELFHLNVCIGNLVFPNLPTIRISQNSIKESFILPASMFGEFVVTLNNPEKTIEFKNNSNQVCYHMHIGDKVFTGQVMCTNAGMDLRTKVKAVVGEAYCDKVISLLPQSASVLNDESLYGAIAVAMTNIKS